MQGFGGETWGKETTWKTQGVDERIILRWIFEKWYGGMDWNDLAQNRNRWRAVVNAVMNLRVPLNVRNVLSSWGPVSFSGRTLFHGVISTQSAESRSELWLYSSIFHLTGGKRTVSQISVSAYRISITSLKHFLGHKQKLFCDWLCVNQISI